MYVAFIYCFSRSKCSVLNYYQSSVKPYQSFIFGVWTFKVFYVKINSFVVLFILRKTPSRGIPRWNCCHRTWDICWYCNVLSGSEKILHQQNSQETLLSERKSSRAEWELLSPDWEGRFGLDQIKITY